MPRTTRSPYVSPGLAFLALGLLLFGACAPAPDDGEGESSAVLLPVPDDPTVSFSVWFRVGSQNDPPGKEGLAALTGELLASAATESKSYEQILAALYPLASSYRIRVDKEMSTLSGRTHVDNVETFYGLFTDAYLHPAFTEEDFNRLKNDQLNYLKTTLRYNSDEDLGKAALESFVFAGTPYAHPVTGTVQGLESVTLDDVKQFYRTHYTRENAVVALGGGYSADLVARFEATLGSLPEGQAPAKPSVTVPPVDGRQGFLVSKADADASISFGFPISVRRGERDFYALWIANSWLGEHRYQAGHLYQVIREKRGLNYGDYSYIETFPQGGQRQFPPTGVGRDHQLFQIWIRTLPNEQAVFAIRAALRALEDLVENGMSEEDFELTRSFLTKYHLHFAETTAERLGYAVDDRFYGIDGESHLERFGEMMASITREEVNAALKKHLQTANLKFAVITGAAEEIALALTSGEPTPITYPTPKSDAIQAEDKEIASYPLGIAAEAVKTVPVEEIFER